LRRLIRHNPLTAFFVIAFGLSWFFQIAALFVAETNDQTLSNEDNLQHLFDLLRGRLSTGEASAYLLFLLGAGPLVAAVGVLSATSGRSGIGDLWPACGSGGSNPTGI